MDVLRPVLQDPEIWRFLEGFAAIERPRVAHSIFIIGIQAALARAGGQPITPQFIEGLIRRPARPPPEPQANAIRDVRSVAPTAAQRKQERLRQQRLSVYPQRFAKPTSSWRTTGEGFDEPTFGTASLPLQRSFRDAALENRVRNTTDHLWSLLDLEDDVAPLAAEPLAAAALTAPARLYAAAAQPSSSVDGRSPRASSAVVPPDDDDAPPAPAPPHGARPPPPPQNTTSTWRQAAAGNGAGLTYSYRPAAAADHPPPHTPRPQPRLAYSVRQPDTGYSAAAGASDTSKPTSRPQGKPALTNVQSKIRGLIDADRRRHQQLRTASSNGIAPATARVNAEASAPQYVQAARSNGVANGTTTGYAYPEPSSYAQPQYVQAAQSNGVANGTTTGYAYPEPSSYAQPQVPSAARSHDDPSWTRRDALQDEMEYARMSQPSTSDHAMYQPPTAYDDYRRRQVSYRMPPVALERSLNMSQYGDEWEHQYQSF